MCVEVVVGGREQLRVVEGWREKWEARVRSCRSRSSNQAASRVAARQQSARSPPGSSSQAGSVVSSSSRWRDDGAMVRW